MCTIMTVCVYLQVSYVRVCLCDTLVTVFVCIYMCHESECVCVTLQ